MPPCAQVPIEVLLKLVTDKVGEQGVKDMLDRTEDRFADRADRGTCSSRPPELAHD
ncbi:MAG: hypothetical protein JO120_11765 [Solirubrobacterales bacterium]|nr:hypothetical protein [Solirubrobacterales bacterium]MBV8940182.1 hypothetical protein [Solirubrobacterales bacterium]